MSKRYGKDRLEVACALALTLGTCQYRHVKGILSSERDQVPLATPDLQEQEAIIEFVDLVLAKLGTLTTEAQRAIDLLQERRTALISAAVTGQIDARATATAL